jgi:PAS domain S-box-containing protein
VFVRKNGEERWAQITAGNFKYNGKPTGLITAIDITECRRSEESLRLVRSFVDRARDLAFFIARSGQFHYVNEAACNTLGYTREELLAMATYDLNPEHAGEKWDDHWEEVKKLGDMTFDTVLMARDGTGIPMEISAKYLTFDDREYVCSFVRDIIERKKSDDALKNAKAQAELYVDLMGHDINNMNQAAMGYLELAEDLIEAEGKLDRNNKLLVSKPLEVLRNASRLIDNVRKIQKEKAGAYKLEVIDVGKMLSEVLAQYSEVAGREMSISYTLFATGLVSANELLRDVFINLIGNAIKHSTGPLAINVIFDKMIEDGKKYCRVAIEDNGPGIPDDLKKKLFDRLTLTATRASGKGFGLCLIKMLVDDFHGRFWVEDRVAGDRSQGSRFVVMLPAVE